MKYFRDLHKKTHKHQIALVHEVFDSSHDIIGWLKKEEIKIKKRIQAIKQIKIFFHFIFLTCIIFTVLILVTNWSAYSAFARTIIAPWELEETKNTIENSLLQLDDTSQADIQEKKEKRKKRILQKQIEKSESIKPELSVNHFDQDINRVSLSVNIAPYEDRIIIPKIGKNIPLVNVEHHDASSSQEWHKIFMKELEKWIIKYPGSANPWESGNSFIFWHSSNYPWAKWDYNEVFALLNELENGDEITVFFKQKKFVYVVTEKKVVKPGNVSSLWGEDTQKRMTLMTCWPLGTTLNRLLVITELKNTTVML